MPGTGATEAFWKLKAPGAPKALAKGGAATVPTAAGAATPNSGVLAPNAAGAAPKAALPPNPGFAPNIAAHRKTVG